MLRNYVSLNLRRQVPLIRLRPQPLYAQQFRLYSTQEQQPEVMDDYEQKVYDILKKEFDPVNLQVKDVSGGCGSMFAILVESLKFKGLPMIKQHRLVNELLKDEIKQWHGLQLRTKGV
ncbi:Altered inheritance of mitochondria protein 1 [Candida viswanathii]|uniref:Altered inheritance of mitochondria protein 1 n=1 Tax=Candida viswanathii TaxID=5486 RepID=A0A367YKL6_9ASCO|nr:Altered inheritance of mitochondria protein 1 [Candida viswanathii]